jgi:hypothetical protein
MKIREVLDKKVGKTKYMRYILILPKNVVTESDFLGKDLKVKFDNNKIVVEVN